MKDAAVGIRKRSDIDVDDENTAEAMRSKQSLHAESLAAFGPASGENKASTASGHAGTKSVRALAMNIARLVCTLHKSFPLQPRAKIALKYVA